MSMPEKSDLRFERDAASFRDPAGFVFQDQQVLYRQINQAGEADYSVLMQSGLYQSLVEQAMLCPHKEVDQQPADPNKVYKIIQPEQIGFISYPYEWSFSQLKDAALLTLKIQKEALKYGAVLKDSSAYNIQFSKGKPILIDTLSFTEYEEGKPWMGYRQFCQHFLAPLALMSKKDIRLGQLLRVYVDGIPLDLASELLPASTRFPGGLYLHIHLHASAQKKYAGRQIETKGQRQISKTQMLGLVESLEGVVRKLEWDPGDTAWASYELEHTYRGTALEAKKTITRRYLSLANPEMVWDLGANTGLFSRIAAEAAQQVIAFDIDPGATEIDYLNCRKEGVSNLLPLVLDLTNPSPGIGWRNDERKTLDSRGKPDLILALALIHHLAISNNLPLPVIVDYFASLAEWLIIEFVPKDDSQVQVMLASRKDIFTDYTEHRFESEFQRKYSMVKKESLSDSTRSLYLFRRLDS